MSGSGGSTYDATPPQQGCHRLNFKTVLNSPNPPVVSALSSGDQLDVVLDTTGGKKKALALWKGQTAGSITSDLLPQLLRCLEAGHVFKAEVITANAGRVEVHVGPA
jgi:hypothetical protein